MVDCCIGVGEEKIGPQPPDHQPAYSSESEEMENGLLVAFSELPSPPRIGCLLRLRLRRQPIPDPITVMWLRLMLRLTELTVSEAILAIHPRLFMCAMCVDKWPPLPPPRGRGPPPP